MFIAITRDGQHVGLDHVQLAMPAGQESQARAFYAGVLGLTEEIKPANLAERCRAAGYPPTTDERLEGVNRVYVSDPFGNRIELLEPA
jgi:hypothetical protein